MTCAHFQANAVRDVYVQLALVDQADEAQHSCSKLAKAMYRIRDAAQNWFRARTDFGQNSPGFDKLWSCWAESDQRICRNRPSMAGTDRMLTEFG